jgi:2-polyprenyl-3-methyl-5-hydroxy-6-metoxy-1,4-benzoquinol methylase
MITRQREHELMDDPSLDSRDHAQALDGLARLNSASGSARSVWRPIRRLYQDLFSTAGGANGGLITRPRPIKILDLACGSADVPLQLLEIASQAGIEISVDGCDKSEIAVEAANHRARRSSAKSTFFQLDVLNDPLPKGYDVITTSLFTHHLEDAQTIALMRKMADATNHLVIINDLVRSQMSLLLVKLACHTLTSSRVVHYDGPASVKSAFTPKELQDIAHQAGLHNATIQERFPCRMVLSWRKPLN